MTLISRPTTIHDLPEELLTEILSHSLLIPLKTFFEQEFDKHMRSARYRREELGLAPDCVLLLVCKQWWRLAEPLLYSSVFLVSMLDMQSITSFLERKPSIGPKVRHVRLHGGFGRALAEFAERASNVEAVYLSSQEVWDSIEVVGALEHALYTLSPSVLYIGFMNKSFGSMLDSYSALMSFVQYSDSLVSSIPVCSLIKSVIYRSIHRSLFISQNLSTSQSRWKTHLSLRLR